MLRRAARRSVGAARREAAAGGRHACSSGDAARDHRSCRDAARRRHAAQQALRVGVPRAARRARASARSRRSRRRTSRRRGRRSRRTTPRLCVIRSTLIPSSSRSSAISSRICAWIVTSSAVVGSSAISSSGSRQQRHRDHHALAHAARELVRVVVEALAGVRDADALEHLDGALARPAPVLQAPVRPDRLDDLRADRERAGRARSSAPGRPSRSRSPRDRAHLGRRQRAARSRPSSSDPPAGDARRRLRQQPHQRERGHRLAAAALADEAERLLAAPSGERHVVDGGGRSRLRLRSSTVSLDLDQRARRPPASAPPAASPVAGRSRHSVCSPRVEDVAQAVAEQVQAEHDAARSSTPGTHRPGRSVTQ